MSSGAKINVGGRSMTSAANIKALEELYAPEIARIRARFGDEQAKVSVAAIERAMVEQLAALGNPPEATIKVNWAEHERQWEAAYKAAQSDVIYKSAAVVPASLEIRFAPEDRDAILAALAAMKPASKLSITQVDGSVTTLERETGLATSSPTSPRPSKPEAQHSSRTDQSFWDSQEHGGSGSRSPQPADAAFWDRQTPKPGKPTTEPTAGQTRGGR